MNRKDGFVVFLCAGFLSFVGCSQKRCVQMSPLILPSHQEYPKGHPFAPIQSLPKRDSEISPGIVLVKFVPGTEKDEIERAHQQVKGIVVEVFPQISVQVVKVPKGTEMEAVATYSKNPKVLYAEPNYTFHLID